MDKRSEEWRVACMERMKALVATLLYEPNKVKKRAAFDAYMGQHGPVAAKEARNVERAIREGKKTLENFK